MNLTPQSFWVRFKSYSLKRHLHIGAASAQAVILKLQISPEASDFRWCGSEETHGNKPNLIPPPWFCDCV